MWHEVLLLAGAALIFLDVSSMSQAEVGQPARHLVPASARARCVRGMTHDQPAAVRVCACRPISWQMSWYFAISTSGLRLQHNQPKPRMGTVSGP